MRILVTGARGFIGSVLCCRLSEQGHEVLAVDNGSRGLNDVSRVPHVDYLEADYRTVLEGFERFSIDAVVHLAAKTGSLSYPLETLLAENADAAVAFYQQARRHGVSVFVFPTTSLALGVPDSPYVVSKEVAVERLLQEPKTGTSPRLLLCRFFNVAGAYRGRTELRTDEVHILPTLWQAYRDQQPFVINGQDYDTVDGTPSRDYVHVVDTADFIMYKCQRLLAGEPHDPSKIVHIGRGAPVTVKQLIDLLPIPAAHPLRWTIGPRRPFDCGELRCPPDAVEALQAWRPLRGIEEIVRDEWQALQMAAHVPEVVHA